MLAGGSYSLALLSASRESGNFVPYNLLFVNATRGAALVCVPAKAGSTSFYFWLYKALAGEAR